MMMLGTSLLALTACDQSNKFTVEGNIEGACDSMLYFEAITLNGVQNLDSVKIKSDGTFSFKADAPGNPEFYALRINGNRINFAVDSTETVRITAKLPGMSTNYKVEGSASSEEIRKIAVSQAQQIKYVFIHFIVKFKDNLVIIPFHETTGNDAHFGFLVEDNMGVKVSLQNIKSMTGGKQQGCKE